MALPPMGVAMVSIATVFMSQGAVFAGELPPFMFANAQMVEFTEEQGLQPGDMAVGDFNGDLRIDMVVAAYDEPRGFLLSLGQPGALPFSEPMLVMTDGSQPPTNGGRGIAAADLNNDGYLDVVLSRSHYGVSISPGNGDGTFAPAIDILTGVTQGKVLWPLRITAFDLENDGDVDLVIVDGRVGSLFVMRNDGGFAFEHVQSIPISGTSQLDVGDLNADGIADLAFGLDGLNVAVAFGDGAGFGAPVSHELVGGTSIVSDVEIIDIDLDGTLDIIVAQPDSPEAWISIMQNSGDGLAYAVVHFNVPSVAIWDIAVTDFDGDQRADIAALDGSGHIWFVRNETVVPGQFQFSFPLHLETQGGVARRIVPVNLKFDCDHDLLVLNKVTSNVTVFDNLSAQFGQCTIADFNFNGAVDGDDLAYLLGEWHKVGSPADLNISGRVDAWDLAFLLWGGQQPQP